MSNKYELRGVSSEKTEVHEAIKSLDKGLFPNSFCKILPDYLTNEEEMCILMHADTAGTKTSLAYLYWKETGDLTVWENIVQDAIVMNLDDMACSGCVSDFVLSSTIGRNKKLITGDVLHAIINASTKFASTMKTYGVNIFLAGGETADVGDIVRTADVGFTAYSRMKRAEVIDCDIKEGDYIVGFAGYGQSTYERQYNSGIGCNGLTSARHDVLHAIYKQKYPETYDNTIDSSLIYAGTKKVTEEVEIDGHTHTYGQLLLSPTRTFLPVLSKILSKHRGAINAIIHNTGGGQYKVEKFLKEGLCAVKDNLLPVPPIFKIIQEESGTSTEEMYKVFNMGTRLELYTSDHDVAQSCIEIAKGFEIDSQIVGCVVRDKNKKVVMENI